MSNDETASDRMNLRVTPTLGARVDAFAEALREATGLRVSRNEAARLLMERALDAAPEMKRRVRK